MLQITHAHVETKDKFYASVFKQNLIKNVYSILKRIFPDV